MSYNKPYTNLVPTNVTVADDAVAVDNSGIQNGLKLVILNINFRSRSQCIAFKVGSYLGTKKYSTLVLVLHCPDATKLCKQHYQQT
jgi:hypothetical protein